MRFRTRRRRHLFRSDRATDEAYWRQVRAQFPLRDDILPLNAANLCPAPPMVVDAVAAGMRDVEGDVSNTTGVRMPTRELCALARSRCIHAHVDGAQTWGASCVICTISVAIRMRPALTSG